MIGDVAIIRGLFGAQLPAGAVALDPAAEERAWELGGVDRLTVYGQLLGSYGSGGAGIYDLSEANLIPDAQVSLPGATRVEAALLVDNVFVVVSRASSSDPSILDVIALGL